MKSHLQPKLTEKKANQATIRRVGQADHGCRGGRFEGGAVMPMTIVALVALIGIAGLVVDFAPVFLDKNKLQHAVDAAALAGAEYLRAHEPVNGSVEATAKEVAVSVFNKQKPESVSDITVDDVGVKGDKVTLSVSGAHATSFLRVIPGAMTNIPVGASSEAGQVKSNVGNICLSPLVICTSPGNQLKATTPNYTKFDVGVDAFVLCGKGESNCTSTIDNKLAQATNQELEAGGNCEFTLPGKIARGKATGQVRAGINSRFFDCGRTLPRGYPNCLSGYPRDN